MPVFTGELPARYTVRFGSKRQDAVDNRWSFGLCFGAISATANSSAFYGSGFIFPSSSAELSALMVIQSGSASINPYDPGGLVGFLESTYPDTNQLTPAQFEYNIELGSLSGTTSGSLWRAEAEITQPVTEINTLFSIINTRSGTYGNWTGIGPLNRLYLAITAPTASVASQVRRTLELDNFIIYKHPLDRNKTLI